jgi:hypothetical protein
MNAPRYHCEDCGFEFEKTEFTFDMEDSWMYCPDCGRLDIQLLSGEEEGFTFVDPSIQESIAFPVEERTWLTKPRNPHWREWSQRESA